MTMILKCRNCGGELHPAEGAAMCKCMLCGTVQAVPAGRREAGTAPEEAAGRDSTEAAREAERAASLQRWQEEREKREKARQEEERRLADEQRQREKEEHLRKAEEARQKNGSRKIMTYSAAGADRAAGDHNDTGKTPAVEERGADHRIRTYSARTGDGKAPGDSGREAHRPAGTGHSHQTHHHKRKEEKRKRTIRIAAIAAAAIVLLGGGYLVWTKVIHQEDKKTQTQAPAITAAPETTSAAAAVTPEPTQAAAAATPEVTETPATPEVTKAAVTGTPEATKAAVTPEPAPSATPDPDAEKKEVYRAALEQLENGNLTEAEAMLESLARWKDADEKLDLVHEKMADRAAEAGDFETAITYYNQLNNRTDETVTKLIAANKGKNYGDAMAALEAGDTETAYARLIAAGDYQDAAEQLSRLNTYRRAGEAMDAGRYTEAREAYIRLGAYLDAAERLEACNAAIYREAAEKKKNGENGQAYELFTLISGYADSDEIVQQMDADYRAAAEHMANGERTEAEALLEGLAGWKDADALLASVREEMADRAAEAGDYETAIAYYFKLDETDAIREKRTAAEQGKNYREAMTALEAGKLETARTKLEAAGDYADAAEQLSRLDAYEAAGEEMAEGWYREAREKYIALGAYLDAADRLEACNAALYREAAEMKKNGENGQAYELFSLISGYADSGEIMRRMDADYRAAIDHMMSGEPAEAEALLAGLTGLKDADALLASVREEIADRAAETGDYDTAIAYYLKLDETDAIRAKAAEAEQGKNYREAEKALAAGEPETAKARFAAAGEYRDAAAQVEKLEAYMQAETLKDAGAFDEAATAYTGLGDYLDCAEQVSACLYAKAEAQLAAQDPDGAAATFRSIADYRDSAERADRILYEKAEALWDSGDLPAARAAFEQLGGYADAPEMMLKVLDEMSGAYIADQAYGAALEMYMSLEQTDAIREREYNLAQVCYDGAYYAEAVAAYEALGQYELSLSKLPVARYAWAGQLFEAGEYEKAAEQFALLGDMSDSATRARESIYQLALGEMENGRYDEAKEHFTAISGHSDADTLAKECDYRKAGVLLDAGKTAEALALYESLGSYSDSRTKADMCIYMQAEELFAAGKYEEAEKLYGSVNYLDSAEKASQCMYIRAGALYESGRYAEAKELYSAADYMDSREKAKDSAYREADGYYRAGQFDEAERCFLELDGYLDSAERIARCHYELGYAAHVAGNMDEAVAQYALALSVPEAAEAVISTARDYITVKEYEKAIQTLWLIRDKDEARQALAEIASAEREAGENVIALLAYTATGDSSLPETAELLDEVAPEAFKEYAQGCTFLPEDREFARDSIYTYAGALAAAGKDEEAVAAYEAVGDYADAGTQILEVRYQQAKRLYDAGEYTAAYDAYTRVKGYKDTDELLKTDEKLIEGKRAPYKTVGNIVTFGSYEQDNDLSDGAEKIEWIVLASGNGKTLLLSRYGLDARPYNEANSGITWEKSTLRAWLNGEFLQAAFTAEEQAAIATADLSNGKAQGHWTTNGGKDTEDQVFLLSCAEAQKYLGVSYKNTKNEKPRTSPTDYAIAQGAGTSAVMTDEERPVGIWWLRSPGLNKESAALVQDGGSLYYRGVTDASVMVRPAILLDLTSDSF